MVDVPQSDVELQQILLECRTLLSKAYDSACNFMEAVGRCFQYGDLDDDRRMAIIEEVKKEDFTQLFNL